ncbi:U3 small nucleolar ribonucleoprotein complex, subunit Mpp10 [Trametes gibbosa]|nr:U3 small nucleolar ribonucleoprotein complex, subunit Mpp10 [Trametes gibbosa]
MDRSESVNENNVAEGPSLPPQLETLSKLIAEKPEALATGSEDLRRTALEATKFIFDLALQTEARSRIIVNDLLTSISPEHAPQTRSQKRKRGATPSPEPETVVSLMRETPIHQLFVDDMSDEQIWAQLELRTQNMCEVLNYALDGPADQPESESEDEGRELKKMRQALIDEGFDPDELDEMQFGDEDEESSEDEDDEEDEESEDPDDDGGDADLGEDIVELRDPSDEEDGEDDPELEIGEPSFLNGGKRTLKIKPKRGGHPVLDDGFFDLAAFNAEIEAAESKKVSRGKLSKDSDSDEEDEDEEDVDYFAAVDGQPVFEEEDEEDAGGELRYRDFFEPPSRTKLPKITKSTKPTEQLPLSKSKGKVRFHEEVRVKKIKAKGKNLPLSTMFDEDEDEDEDEDDDDGSEEEASEDEGEGSDQDEDMEDDEAMLSGESEDDGDEDEGEDSDDAMEGADYETMERLKDDLFADEEDEQRQDGLSTYEKRMAALREEIATLEAENVGKKDWTLMGEANSRTRPQNSLLEEDLEFERVMKSVPVITEEVVHSLEERIKARILDSQFDDVVRKRPVDDKPFLPSRFFELQDTKSKQSLAEIYEDEYSAAQAGGVAGEDRDGKLKKEHQEIEKLWENICGKLDALCNAHFTPKAPKATITTVTNVAAASLESALPTTKATTTMLAPEEVYVPSASALRARSELTPTEKRALRNKQKKAKKKAHDAIQKTAEKVGRLRGVGDVKRQKDAALKSLVKSGKGVTVVGKKNKEVESKRGKGKS